MAQHLLGQNTRGVIRGFAAVAIALSACLTAIPAHGEEPSQDARLESRLRAIADGVTLADAHTSARGKITRLADPIYRFDDPARQLSDGTVWAWCRSGRPLALLTIAPERKDGLDRWLCELSALVPEPVTALVPGAQFWMPTGGDVVDRKIAGAPAPADSEGQRLRQMKELARRFKAYELYQPEGRPEPERYELRLLPHPLHRYADPGAGRIDGGLFVFAYARNPEIALVIEARREGSSDPAWHSILSRISGAELHVSLDDKEVWKQPPVQFGGRRDLYWFFVRPMVLEEPPAGTLLK